MTATVFKKGIRIKYAAKRKKGNKEFFFFGCNNEIIVRESSLVWFISSIYRLN